MVFKKDILFFGFLLATTLFTSGCWLFDSCKKCTMTHDKKEEVVILERDNSNYDDVLENNSNEIEENEK